MVDNKLYLCILLAYTVVCVLAGQYIVRSVAECEWSDVIILSSNSVMLLHDNKEAIKNNQWMKVISVSKPFLF